MALTVKKITLWRGEVEDKPGVLGNVLGPLAGTGTDLQVVMGYHYHGPGNKAAIEVYPVSGKKATAAAGGAGLAPRRFPRSWSKGTTSPAWAPPWPRPLPRPASTSASLSRK